MERALEDPKIKDTGAFVRGRGRCLLQTVIIKVVFYKCLRQRADRSELSAPEAHTWRGNGTRTERELNCCSLHKHSRAAVFLGSLRGKEGSGDSHGAAALNP